MRPYLTVLTIAATLLAPFTAQAALPPRTPPLDAAALVARWQLAHLDDLTGVRTFREDAADPRGWIRATFLIGLTALADATDDPAWSAAIDRFGAAARWRPGDRPRHADDDAVAQAWVWSAARARDPARLAPTRARLDAVLAAPSTVSLDFAKRAPGAPDPDCQVRWCWADALFMAPPLYAAMTAATGDPRYLAHADREVQVTNAALFDPAEQLYYRDTRYVTQRGPAGRKLFWGRGNGWAFAGLARFIAAMPAGSPMRARYVAQFRAMAGRIVALQGEAGYWPTSLLDPSPTPETSGTAFFVYGLAWGVNAGLLDEAAAGAAIDRGWQALLRATDADGRLHWVQQVGSAPDSVRAEDGELYGSGGLLLAASEMAKRVKPVAAGAGAAESPRATVSIAPYRYGDLLWENDRTAHRIYGRALEAVEPPSSSGIDAWGKRTRAPFMAGQLRQSKQHIDTGDGIDFYHVSTARGAGGLGIWHDNKLWTSRNYARVRIVNPGPQRAEFEVDYAPWPVDVGRKVWETRRFTLPMGTSFTRMVSTIRSDSAAALTVGIGLSKRPTGPELGSFIPDPRTGRFVFWGPKVADKGTMGVALLIDPATIAGVTEDADNFLVLVRVKPGKPFVYYTGAAWDGGADIHDRAGWQAYVAAQRPNFDPAAR